MNRVVQINIKEFCVLFPNSIRTWIDRTILYYDKNVVILIRIIKNIQVILFLYVYMYI